MDSFSAEGPFLQSLFSRLNTAGIHYAVMRNHDSLPYSAGGSDLDIFTTGSEYLRAKEIFLSVVSEIGGKIIGVVETWLFYEAYVIGYADGKWWGVCVEFYKEIVFKSAVPLVNYHALYSCLEVHNNLKVISRDYGNAIGYVKEILAHNHLRPDKLQYRKSVTNLLKESRDLFADVFEPLGSMGQLFLSRTVFAEFATSDEVAKIRRFRHAVIARAFFRRPLNFVYRRLRHEFYRISRYINPPGSFVAILGVDGAGKSTVIDAILPALNSAMHRAVFVQHLRPGLLPPLARLKGKAQGPVGPVVDPHGSTPSGYVGSVLRLSYLSLDYILGYWIKVRTIIAKRPALMIFDRYSYDMALDPRRFRIGLSGRVVGWFSKLAPKPDLIFCLHGSPDRIAARKGELPLEETYRQIAALHDFAANEPRAVLISTDSTIEETRDEVLMVLLEYLQKKFRVKR